MTRTETNSSLQNDFTQTVCSPAAEQLLRDAAFVLHLTQRLRRERCQIDGEAQGASRRQRRRRVADTVAA